RVVAQDRARSTAGITARCTSRELVLRVSHMRLTARPEASPAYGAAVRSGCRSPHVCGAGGDHSYPARDPRLRAHLESKGLRQARQPAELTRTGFSPVRAGCDGPGS